MNEVYYDWLIIFFVHEIPLMSAYSAQLIKIIKNIKAGPNNLVFVIRDEATSAGNAQFCFKLQVWKLSYNTESNNNEFLPLAGLILDNRDRNSWKKAFSYIYTHFKSKRKIIVTYSHGAGFGINRDHSGVIRAGTLKPEVPIAPEAIHFIEGTQPLSISGKPTGASSKKIAILWVTDIAEMLAACLPGDPIDILLMINCNMQLIDNGYNLRENVKLLIAPEGLMRADGYDFAHLLETVCHNPSISNDEMAIQIRDAFIEKHRRNNMPASLSKATLFANQLIYFDETRKILDELTGILLNDIDFFMSGLTKVRNTLVLPVTYDFLHERPLPLELIDLGQWIHLVSQEFPEIFAYRRINERFEDLREKITIAGYVGDEIRKRDNENAFKYGFSGISIYYPKDFNSCMRDAASHYAYFGDAIDSRFIRESKWKNFLSTYYKKLQAS